MNPNEYKQLRAYALYDGIYLAIIWAASFACFLGMTWHSLFGLGWMLLLLSTPLFVSYRLGKYRNEALGGSISFARALFYSLRVFLTGSLVFAFIQWAYMQFIDGGKLLGIISLAVHSPETKDILAPMQLTPEKYMSILAPQLSPLSLATSSIVNGMVAGAVLSLMIAAMAAMMRK